MIAYYIKKN